MARSGAWYLRKSSASSRAASISLTCSVCESVTAIPSAKTSDYGGQGEFSMDFSLIWSFDPRKWCVIFIGTVLFPGSMRVADSGIKTANKWTVSDEPKGKQNRKERHQRFGRRKTMNRWMKRRIERSRARCEAQERNGSSRIDSPQTGFESLTDSFLRISEKQSSKLRMQAKVEQ
jgi:hypothetical protein